MNYIDLIPSVEKVQGGYIEWVSLIDNGLSIARDYVGEIATSNSNDASIAYRHAVKQAEVKAREHNANCHCGKQFRVNTSPKLRGVTA